MIKRFTFILLAVFICIFAQGCTSRQWFEGIKEAQRQDCYKIASPSERQKCLDKLDGMSYDQYKKEREAVLKKPELE